MILALILSCVSDPIAPTHEPIPWEDARPFAFDRDKDGYCGAGKPTIWLLPDQEVPPHYVACPFSGGAFLGFDCDDHDPERWAPLNLGEPGGCGDDPWAS